MRAFTREVADLLNGLCAGNQVSSVGLGKYNLSLSFDGQLPTIGAESKATLSIRGNEFEWSGEPIAAPVWTLAGQTVEKFELRSSLVLRMHLTSGDYVDFHTKEEPYEAVVMDFGSQNGALVMEVF